MLAPEIKRRPALAAGGVGGVVVIAAVGMLAGGKHFLSHPLSTLFQTGGSTSVQQRYDIWTAALHIAAHHPVTGVGPDAFALVYPQYQSAAWVAALRANYLVNGAHDIFMNVLADQGFVGLLLFLGLLVLLSLRQIGAWRRLRSLELGENTASTVKEEAQVHRVTVAIVSASMVAYIVQAVFNVQQVGLSFSFWLLVGAATVLAQAAGVPDTLRPGALISAVPAEEGLVEPAEADSHPGRPRRGIAIGQPAQEASQAAPGRALADPNHGCRRDDRPGVPHPRPGWSLPGGPRLLGRLHEPQAAGGQLPLLRRPRPPRSGRSTSPI